MMKTYLIVLLFACALVAVESRKKSHKRKHQKSREDAAAAPAADAAAAGGAPAKEVPTDPNLKNEFLIRNFGSFMVGLRDLNDPNYAQDVAAAAAEGGGAAATPAARRRRLALSKTGEGEAPAADAAAAGGAAAAPKAPPAPGSEFPDLEMFSSYNKIELPVFCKTQLDEKQILGIAFNARNFVGNWTTAAGAADAKFYDLPCLEPAQFGAFYKTVNAGAKAASDEVAAEEGEAEAENLVKVVNFMDPKLTKACWLQYWVYMCSNGIQPEDKYYKHEEGKSEAKFDAYLAKKLGMQMAEAGNKFGSAFGKKKRRSQRKFRKF